MKRIIVLVSVVTVTACTEPINVTGKTDQQSTTSGTMGSVKANNQLPAFDTPAQRTRVDTTRKQ